MESISIKYCGLTYFRISKGEYSRLNIFKEEKANVVICFGALVSVGPRTLSMIFIFHANRAKERILGPLKPLQRGASSGGKFI